MSKLKNISGFRFGRLLVVNRAENVLSEKSTKTMWNCICDCGSYLAVRSTSLMVGDTKSCGCILRDIFEKKSMKRSGMAEYRIYRAMISRCTNKKVRCYVNYGGRGISVCDRWLFDFDNFIRDMGLRPSLSHSIERINNHGNYCPDNCKWATIGEQAKNRSNNYHIEFNGEKMILQDWAIRIGITSGNLKKRINKWGISEALTRPVRVGEFRNKKYLNYPEASR